MNNNYLHKTLQLIGSVKTLIFIAARGDVAYNVSNNLQRFATE